LNTYGHPLQLFFIPRMSARNDIPSSVKSYWYPDRTADLKEVRAGYKTWDNIQAIVFMMLIPIVLVALSLFMTTAQGVELYSILAEIQQQIEAQSKNKEFWVSFSIFLGGSAALLIISTIFFMKRATPIYLIDFTTFQPPDNLKISHEQFMEKTTKIGAFDKESIDFQEKLLYRTGLGNETYFPPGIMQETPVRSMQKAREEAEMVLSAVLDQLFQSTGLNPKDVDILIVNCSLFNPTPSLSAMIINKYKMRSDIRNYNLSGMGCSAGVISVDLVKDLLQVHKNCNAVIVSTENITQNWYLGNQKAMLVSNTIFRLGGAAIFLSNKWKDSWRAKYRLVATVRVHKGASDKAYRAVYQEEDSCGRVGVSLAKDLIAVAGDALKSNLTVLGPIVLPWSEQIKFFVVYLKRRLEGLMGKKKRTPSYVPDFKKAFQHFCIHAGGRAIIDGLEENLKLEPHHVEPSRATLYRYGNTSTSSIWYELAFIELSKRIKKGDNVFQIALGSGFKCNSAVWRRICS